MQSPHLPGKYFQPVSARSPLGMTKHGPLHEYSACAGPLEGDTPMKSEVRPKWLLLVFCLAQMLTLIVPAIAMTWIAISCREFAISEAERHAIMLVVSLLGFRIVQNSEIWPPMLWAEYTYYQLLLIFVPEKSALTYVI